MKMKKAFTIIELMAVIAIIAVLMTIVTTTSSKSMKAAREQRANACCKLVHQGLETYYTQKDQWPGAIGDAIKNGTGLSRGNNEGIDGSSDPDRFILNGSEIRDMVATMVKECVQNHNQLMDVSGLFVSRFPGEGGSRHYGLNFVDAVHGTKESPKKMSISEMYYGYPESDSGYFRRFKMTYIVPANIMSVTRQ